MQLQSPRAKWRLRGPPARAWEPKALPCLSKAWNWGGGTSAPEQKHAAPQSSINAVTEDNVLQRRRLARASLLYKPLPAATARMLSLTLAYCMVLQWPECKRANKQRNIRVAIYEALNVKTKWRRR